MADRNLFDDDGTPPINSQVSAATGADWVSDPVACFGCQSVRFYVKSSAGNFSNPKIDLQLRQDDAYLTARTLYYNAGTQTPDLVALSSATAVGPSGQWYTVTMGIIPSTTATPGTAVPSIRIPFNLMKLRLPVSGATAAAGVSAWAYKEF